MGRARRAEGPVEPGALKVPLSGITQNLLRNVYLFYISKTWFASDVALRARDAGSGTPGSPILQPVDPAARCQRKRNAIALIK